MAESLGPYTLGQPLSALPFGDLIEATHAARREPIALLILADELAREHRLRGLLRLEIARAGGLRHPAIARPIEVAEHDGRLFVVYERPAGEPLSRWIEDQQGLTLAAVAPMVRSLADGLDAAHGRRLAHGSIQPSAVVVRGDGGLTLLGVGVLAAIDEAGLADACRAKLDEAYAAPEQQTGKLAVPSADAFALGRLARMLAEAAVEGRAGQLPSAVQAALDRQSSAGPAARFRTCAEFARVLAESLTPPSTAPTITLLADHSAASTPIATPPPRMQPSTPRGAPSSAPTQPEERPRSAEIAPAAAQQVPAALSRTAPKRRLPPSEGAWRQDGRSRVRSLSETPSRRDAVHSALPGALLQTIIVSAGPFVLLVFALVFRDTLLFILAIAGLVVLQVPAAIQRAIRLRRARTQPSIVQALGPVRVVARHPLGVLPFPTLHRLEVGEIDSLTISGAAFTAISAVGTHMHVELDAEGKVPPHDNVYDLTALATYSRTGNLLLEIRHPNSELIYTDPAYAGEDDDELGGAGA